MLEIHKNLIVISKKLFIWFWKQNHWGTGRWSTTRFGQDAWGEVSDFARYLSLSCGVTRKQLHFKSISCLPDPCTVLGSFFPQRRIPSTSISSPSRRRRTLRGVLITTKVMHMHSHTPVAPRWSGTRWRKSKRWHPSLAVCTSFVGEKISNVVRPCVTQLFGRYWPKLQTVINQNSKPCEYLVAVGCFHL